MKYYVCWTLMGAAVKQVLGREEKFRIKLRYIVRFPTACCGEWAFPNTKSIQCGTKDIFSRAMSLINVQRGTEDSKPKAQELSIDRNARIHIVPNSYYI